MSAPEGYKRQRIKRDPGTSGAGASEHCVPSEEYNCVPDGYKKQRRKRDEHSAPRLPVVVGRPKICKVCYRSKHLYVDTICPRCLKDWNELAKLEKEIAAVFPATSKLTTPQIFRRLWERSQKLATQNAKLKAQLARPESLKDLVPDA